MEICDQNMNKQLHINLVQQNLSLVMICDLNSSRNLHLVTQEM